MKEITNILDLFPSRNFLIEVDKDNTNEEAATKLLESAVKGTELIPGLKVTKIYPKVATVESIEKNELKSKIDSALKYLDDVKQYIKDSMMEYKNVELSTDEYGVIQKFLKS